jgi:choline dehydrogenase-like flavoprotein
MLSGVGPSGHLKEYGISVVHDLPGVGANLVDHPVVDMYLKDKKNDSNKVLKPKSISGVLHLLGEVAKYQIFGTGKLATNVSGSIYLKYRRSHSPLNSLVNRLRSYGRTILSSSLPKTSLGNWKTAHLDLQVRISSCFARRWHTRYVSSTLRTPMLRQSYSGTRVDHVRYAHIRAALLFAPVGAQNWFNSRNNTDLVLVRRAKARSC